MFEPIYVIDLKYADGIGTPAQKMTGDPNSGYGYSGSGALDIFARDRKPTEARLAAMLTGTAYTCADLNASLVASTRLRLYVRNQKGKPKAKFMQAAERMGRKVTARIPAKRICAISDAYKKHALLDALSGGDDDIEEVTEHPILDLLRAPENAATDGGLTAYDHRWLTQISLDTWGRCYWLIEDEGGVPRYAHMMIASQVIELLDTTGERYLTGYQYGPHTFTPEQVIRFARPSLVNPHHGFDSPMKAAAEVINLVRGGHAFANALQKNGGYPTSVISPKDSDGVMSAEAVKRLRGAFRDATGMANAGMPVVMPDAVTMQSVAFKPADIIDVEKMRELQGEIAGCFGVPTTKIFRNTSNLASAETGDRAHAKDAGVPRCTRMEEVLNAQLVSLYDKTGRLFLAFDSPVPEDRVFALEQTRTGVEVGLTDMNEGRAAIGLDPVADEKLGKTRLVSNTLVLLSPDGTSTPLQPPPEPAPVAAPKPKKSKTAAALLRLAEVLEKQLTREAERKTVESGDGNDNRGSGVVQPAGEIPVTTTGAGERNGDHGNSHALDGAAIADREKSRRATAGVGKGAKDRASVKSALLANGYTPEEAEERMKGERCECEEL